MDLRDHDRRALALVDTVLRDLDPAELELATPCAGWNLADLLRHQVSENNGFAGALWHGTADDWTGGQLGTDAYGAYAASVDAYLAALDADGVLERDVTVGTVGTFPGHVAIGMHLVDSLAHGWDLARTRALTFTPDADLVAAAMPIVERIPTDVRRGPGFNFGPVVPLPAAPNAAAAPDAASEFDRFLALLGRDPAWPNVRVSRRIAAPAHAVFALLADPNRHLAIDGSGMLRGAVEGKPITAAGDVFTMNMHFGPIGDYQMHNHVVEYELDRRIGWEPRVGPGHPDADSDVAADGGWHQTWSYQLEPDGPDATVLTEIYDCSRAPVEARVDMDQGRTWLGVMRDTLRRIDEVVTGRPAQD